MNPPEENDPLDALLRERNRYVTDDGFTARVLAGLPRRRAQSWWRQAFLLGTTAMGWGLAALWLPWENLPALNLSALLSLNSQVLCPWALVLSVAGALTWAILAAIQWED